MKKLVIREFGEYQIPEAAYLDLETAQPKNCIGCWTCWWTTPGRCVHKDLEEFYENYVNADKAIFFAKLQEGFISSRMKGLFDRMIPLFLPYTVCHDGGTWHTPRYPKYPDIEFYYDYDFEDEAEYQIFHDYIQKVFKQFHSENIKILPVSALQEEKR